MANNVQIKSTDQNCFGLIKKLRDWEEDNQQNADARKKEFVLLLGETGSGKSTLAQFLDDDSKLQSIGRPGEYTIVDEAGRISDPDKTILSHTIHPECLSSSINVCDCPGFGDSRSTEQDICCQYFTRNVLASFEAVKLLFVISHAKMQAGGDRNGFLNLIKHAAEFVKDMRKFEKSIALVVTKVENMMNFADSNPVLISDEILKENIIAFMKAVKETIKVERNGAHFSSEKSALYESAVEFIDILCGDSWITSRLALFRKPSEPGPIDQMRPMENAKIVLNKVINDELIFAKSSPDDFSYALSEQSKLHIVDLIPSVVKILNPFVTDAFGNTLNRYYLLEDHEAASVESLVVEFSKHAEFWKDSWKQLEKLYTTTDVLSFLMRCLKSIPFNTATDCHFSQDLNYYLELLYLFEGVTKSRLMCGAPDWLSSSNRIKDFVQISQIWYSTLQTIFSNLSNYEMQERIGSQWIVDINESLLKWFDQKTPVDGKEFKAIFDTVYQCGVSDDLEISTVKMKHLHRQWNSYLAELSPKIANNLKDDMKEAFKCAIRRYGELENKDDIGVETLRDQFEKHAELWRITSAKLSKLDNTLSLVEVMLEHLDSLRSKDCSVFVWNEDDEKLRKSIEYFIEFSSHLEKVDKHQFKISRSDFLEVFDESKEYVQSCLNWYSNLTKVGNLNAPDLKNMDGNEWIPRCNSSLSNWLKENLKINGKTFQDTFDVLKFEISDNLEINTAKLKHMQREWITQLDALIPDVTDMLSELMKKIFENVLRLYGDLEGNDEASLEILQEQFRIHAANWKNAAEKLPRLQNSVDIFSTIMEHLQRLDFPGEEGQTISIRGHINQENLNEKCKLLGHLEVVTDRRSNSGTVNWLDEFDKAKRFVDGCQIWYCTTLPTIHNNLFNYDIQRKGCDGNVSAFEECLAIWLGSGKHVNGKEFTEAFDKITKCGVPDHLDINSAKLRHLQRLLPYAPTDSAGVGVEHDGDNLTIKGNVILLSSVFKWLAAGIKSLEILASNKIYIDCDLNASGRNLQCFFIAPEWEVIGDGRKIVLDGNNAEPHKEVTNSNRHNGEDGKSGGCAGNFVGIGSKIIKGEYLEITAIGGNGGNGQNGEDGLKGRDGKDAEVTEKKIFSQKSLHEDMSRKGNLVKDKTGLWQAVKAKFGGDPEENQYKLYGTNGKNGESGGNGGAAGCGGFPGIISFMGFDRQQRMPDVKNSPGGNGEPGSGGKGGDGGKHGSHILVSVKFDYPHAHNTTFEILETECRDQADPGKEGDSGRKAEAQKLNVDDYQFKYFGPSLEKYLNYIRENVKRGPFKSVTKPFMTYLEENIKTEEISDVSKLARRFIIAEEKIESSTERCVDNYKILIHEIFEYVFRGELRVAESVITCFLFVATLCRQMADPNELNRISQPTFASQVANYILGNGNEQDIEVVAHIHSQLFTKLSKNENILKEIELIKGGMVVDKVDMDITSQAGRLLQLIKSKHRS